MELVQNPSATDQGTEYLCYNCGPFVVAQSVEVGSTRFGFSPEERAKLAHGMVQRGTSVLTYELADSIIEATQLPEALAVLDNLLLHMAHESTGPGEPIHLEANRLRATLGVRSASAAKWAIEQAVDLQMIRGAASRAMDDADFTLANASLTMLGWQRIDELRKNANRSRKAFMAMKFGDSELDGIFREHLRPSVDETGFRLVRLDDEPRAGLIDDRLRLEIRTSRFIVADLTHANNGAYWEAGFAEGLGRPVIYTCRKDVFESATSRPHFDTNHHLTVVWDPNNPRPAMEVLKSAIRVTLPTEASLQD
jgi:hypothetical protein